MLDSVSIKSLYVPALAEGEGVGTAYEYFAKRLVLSRWLRRLPKRPKTTLIAGLPEKYGSSLDFVLLAAELGSQLTIVDDRPDALEKAERGLAQAQQERWLPGFTAVYQQTSLTNLEQLGQTFDLVVSSEVLQRLSIEQRGAYLDGLVGVGTAVALFTPNGDNPAHTNLSGLSGLTLAELDSLLPDWQTGYIDMPPFPPGMIRTDDQREQATSGLLEAVAMWGLGFYARLESVIPPTIRRQQSHIVYAFSPIGS